MELKKIKRKYYFVIWRGRVAAFIGGCLVLISFDYSSEPLTYNSGLFIVGFLMSLWGVVDGFSLFNRDTYLRLHNILTKNKNRAAKYDQPWK